LPPARRPEALVHDLLSILRASSSSFKSRTEPSSAQRRKIERTISASLSQAAPQRAAAEAAMGTLLQIIG
jgi:hypothetical protein